MTELKVGALASLEWPRVQAGGHGLHDGPRESTKPGDAPEQILCHFSGSALGQAWNAVPMRQRQRASTVTVFGRPAAPSRWELFSALPDDRRGAPGDSGTCCLHAAGKSEPEPSSFNHVQVRLGLPS